MLYGAISEDDGTSWRGHREVAREPAARRAAAPSGDHGTAHPYPAVLADGTVLVTTGQGAGRVNIVRIDPEWLCEYPCHGHAVDHGFLVDGVEVMVEA